MDFGEKLSKLRKDNNLSQEQLAEELEVTRQTISNWELNETTPNLEQLRKISNFFQVSIDDLSKKKQENSNRKDFLIRLYIIIGIIWFIAGCTMIDKGNITATILNFGLSIFWFISAYLLKKDIIKKK